MRTVSETIRKATTFLLAVFLWLHALFFVTVQSALVSKITHLLRLTTSEIVLFVLLVIFSFLAASGFWKTVVSFLYIYFFPFVLVGYALYGCFLLLRGLNRWLNAHASPQIGALAVEQTVPDSAPLVSDGSDIRPTPKEHLKELWRFLLRPFRRFMFLWCILLLVSTHTSIVWLCLIVVLAHLARRMFLILKILFFSDPWLREIGPNLVGNLKTALAELADIALDSAPEGKLRQLRNQLFAWRGILTFLQDPYRTSRWSWVLGCAFLGSMYLYIALLFSFSYYGIARLVGVSYSLTDALVTSIFIPFFVADLPKIFALRMLGGIHCLIVVAVGFGTFLNFLHRKLDVIRRAAADLNERFTEQGIREKYIILEARFSIPPVATPSKAETDKRGETP